jgi:hypothetical protein
MMKKILLVIMLLMLATSVQGAFTTQVAGTIGTLTGVGSLSGSALTVSITSTDGATTYVSGGVGTGTYLSGMTILSPSVSLNYSSTYTYKLTVATVGNFSYNFTTPTAPGASIVWSDSDDYSGYTDWYTADSTCTAKTTGGYTWRLPTAPELLKKYIDTSGSGFSSDYYWSGTTHPLASGYAYVVGMVNGYVSSVSKDVPDFLVRCVRDQ